MSTPSSRGPEALLAHRQWIERAARALVRGDADADDVVQDVWLGILSRPPVDEPRRVRAWLRSALWFRSIDAARAAASRRTHERVAARTDRDDADPSDVVARVELLDRVAHAVLDLDEPYRTTVLLHYFDQLSAREIAERLGLPVETVRTRLKRAVARLRARLDAEHDGDRRTWCLALAPLLRRPSPGSAAAAAVGGVVLMGTKTKVGIAAVAIALAVAGYVAVQEGVPGLLPMVRSAGGTVREVARVPVEPQTDPAPASAAVVTGGTLSVSVTGPDREPLGGARIEVRSARDGSRSAWRPAPLLASGETGATGSAAIRLDADALMQLREVHVSRPGFASERVRTAETELAVALRPAAALRGFVYEAATGRRLGGVPVVVTRGRRPYEAEAGRATSAEDGTFALERLAAGRYTVRTRSPRWEDSERSDLVLQAGRSGSLEIALEPGVTVAGRVVDAVTGEPLTSGAVRYRANAGVALDPDTTKRAALGDRGRFLLRGLPRWARKSLTGLELEAPGYRERLATKLVPVYDMAGQQTRDAELLAKPSDLLTGIVLAPDGSPVAGARVAFGQPDLMGNIGAMDVFGQDVNRMARTREGVTAADGTYRIGAGGLLGGSGNRAFERRMLVVHPDHGILFRWHTVSGTIRRVERYIWCRSKPSGCLASRPRPVALATNTVRPPCGGRRRLRVAFGNRCA